jgi:serine/threonine protein phosphatase PrpC
MNITTATEKNNRPYQEDNFFVHEVNSTILLGVFDGHGGEDVSEFCALYSPQIFDKLKKEPESTILKRIIRKLNTLTSFPARVSGSTASLVFINSSHTIAHVAILGDSPVIIRDANNNIWIAPEHNVRSNPAEAKKAVTKYPGFIMQGYLGDSRKPWYGGLQMSRALGDADFNSILNRNPEVFQIPINENSWILCGSDGIFDAGHIDSDLLIHNMIELIDNPDTTADIIIQNTPKDDNATAILVRM